MTACSGFRQSMFGNFSNKPGARSSPASCPGAACFVASIAKTTRDSSVPVVLMIFRASKMRARDVHNRRARPFVPELSVPIARFGRRPLSRHGPRLRTSFRSMQLSRRSSFVTSYSMCRPLARFSKTHSQSCRTISTRCCRCRCTGGGTPFVDSIRRGSCASRCENRRACRYSKLSCGHARHPTNPD